MTTTAHSPPTPTGPSAGARSEWHWQGTQTDGGRLDMAGVIVFGVRDDRFAWARLYVEPVERAGAGIEAAVRDMTADR